MKRVAVIGASIGGLIAAAELRRRDFDVRILERGKTVAGLYGSVDTPFGTQELGMHVMYVSSGQLDLLRTIFGEQSVQSWDGYSVDIGASHNFGRTCFDSVYPDIRGLPEVEQIRREVLAARPDLPVAHALDECVRRFGGLAATRVYAPILEKLWGLPADRLAAGAVHAFFDLRRIVAFGKQDADRLKRDPWLDSTIANPIQNQPAGTVYGGRHAVRFMAGHHDLETRAAEWMHREGIQCDFDKAVQIADGRLVLDGAPLDEVADGCIVATPVAGMAPALSASLHQAELSIFYLRLERSLLPEFPSYYILCHAPDLRIARIVNYEAYHAEARAKTSPVIAVEAISAVGEAPDDDTVIGGVRRVLPSAAIDGIFRLPRSLKVATPSVSNAKALDALSAGMEGRYVRDALFFTGMRTDKGIFFSHHTIGSAHEAAMECIERLS